MPHAPGPLADARGNVPRMSMRTPTVACLLLALTALVGCDEGTQHAQHEIIQAHVPRLQEIVREDIERGVTGVQQAATKLQRGFLVEDPEVREREMRTALHLLRQPPRGIEELMISPISFIAAVDANGIVICRDAEPDPMAEFDAGAELDLVHRALTEGFSGYALEEVPGIVPGQPGSQTVLYVAPSRRDGRIVGAVLAGTPLWRTAQRIGRQLQADQADDVANGLILWAYIYRGDELHHHGTPADLDTIVPDAAARAAGLARSPGGFTGEVMQFGRWYAYGVVPLPRIGPDVGMVVFRSDPI